MDVGVSGIFSSISAAIKLADFCTKLQGVPVENKVYWRLIQGVRDDLEEVSRLLRIDGVQNRLELYPGRKRYVERTIVRVKDALNDIAQYVESVRRDEQKNGGKCARYRFRPHNPKSITVPKSQPVGISARILWIR